MTFTQDIEKYIEEVKKNDASEIELLLDKVTESYHLTNTSMVKFLNYYFITFIIYLVVKIFDISQIEIIGITINQSITFSSLFLIISAYFFYRHSSLAIHKQYLFVLYSVLSNNSKRTYFKYMYHYFLIPDEIGLIEEIHKKKFRSENLHYDLIDNLPLIIGYLSIAVLFVMNIIDTSKIDIKEIQSYKMVLSLVSVAVSTMLVIVSINNFRNFLKINNLKIGEIASR